MVQAEINSVCFFSPKGLRTDTIGGLGQLGIPFHGTRQGRLQGLLYGWVGWWDFLSPGSQFVGLKRISITNSEAVS